MPRKTPRLTTAHVTTDSKQLAKASARRSAGTNKQDGGCPFEAALLFQETALMCENLEPYSFVEKPAMKSTGRDKGYIVDIYRRAI
jgi:hypothetical protein